MGFITDGLDGSFSCLTSMSNWTSSGISIYELDKRFENLHLLSCRFSNSVSISVALTWTDTSCLASCPHRFVSRLCPLFQGPHSPPFHVALGHERASGTRGAIRHGDASGEAPF
jgi:hypothetical protein